MDNKRKIIVPATLDAANRKKDRSVSLRATTNLEINNEDFAMMDTFVSHSGWLLFSENELTANDVPEYNALESEGKSPSQRLYSVMFVAWNELTDKSTPFEYWRVEQMEKIINQYKAKLPERG
jgi:hypothetical protein